MYHAIPFLNLVRAGLSVFVLALISSLPAAVPPSSPTVRISIQPSTNRGAVVKWAPPQATLQSGPTIAGSFANVAGATSPYRVDTRLNVARGYRACLSPPTGSAIYIWIDEMNQPGRVVLDWSPRNWLLQQTTNLVQWQSAGAPATDWYYPPPLDGPLLPTRALTGLRAFRLVNLLAANEAPGGDALNGVFSVNLIGYANLAFRVGQSNFFSFVLRGADFSLNTLLPLPPEADGTVLFFYEPSTQSFGPGNEFFGDGIGWLDPSGNVPQANASTRSACLILPRSSQTGATRVVSTMVGEVPQGTFQRILPPGYSLNGPLIPVSGGITTAHGLNPNEGDLVLLFNPVTRDLDAYVFFEQWEPIEPQIGPGDAFFYVNESGSPLVWTRAFMLN